jgi:predicted small lipoprotein YifL
MRGFLFVIAVSALAACGAEPPAEEAPPAENEMSGLEARVDAARNSGQRVEDAQAAAQARIDSQMQEVTGDSTR